MLIEDKKLNLNDSSQVNDEQSSTESSIPEKKEPVKTKPEFSSTVAKGRLLMETIDLCKFFGNTKAINKVNLKIYQGQHIGIVGPNGGGKSTLTGLISGVLKPTGGKIKYYLNDKKPTTLTGEKELGRNIGMQFQESKYPIGLKVNDMLKFYLNLYKIPDKKKVLEENLDTFNLRGLEKKNIMRLSGGQQQRVNIALSVIHNPRIVIFDEISTGLDIKARSAIKLLVKKLAAANNWTLLLVSHNMDEINDLCDRVLYIRYGTLAHDLPLESIKDQGLVNFVDEQMEIDDQVLRKSMDQHKIKQETKKKKSRFHKKEK